MTAAGPPDMPWVGAGASWRSGRGPTACSPTGPSGRDVTVLEKEPTWAAHQTGRNSGVIHAGLYYPPGSVKALMCRAGARSMVRVLREQEGIAHQICGKLIVATRRTSCPGCTRCTSAGWPAACPSARLSAAEAREHEPHVAARRGAARGQHRHRRLRRGVRGPGRAGSRTAGADLRLGAEVAGRRPARRPDRRAHAPRATSRPTCWSTAPACTATGSPARPGLDPPARIVPFRGEYYELRPERRAPGARPGLPGARPRRSRSSGVHLTRDDRRQRARRPQRGAGPRPRGLPLGARSSRGTLADTLAWPGLWRLGPQHLRVRLDEVRPVAVAATCSAQSLRRLVPELRDGRPGPGAGAGVRAQALHRDGDAGRRLPDRARRPAGARAQRAVAGRHQRAGDRPARRVAAGLTPRSYAVGRSCPRAWYAASGSDHRRAAQPGHPRPPCATHRPPRAAGRCASPRRTRRTTTGSDAAVGTRATVSAVQTPR